jgi:8-oxo-dGTP diphosphatase
VSKRAREIAAAILLDKSGCMLLQRRDDKPDIAQPGKVSMFGGHREGAESFLECVVREIREEISHHIPADRFRHLLTLDGVDPEVPGGRVRGEFFVAYDISTEALIVTEGALLIVRPEAISELRHELTPLTALMIDSFRNCSRD